MQVQVPRVIDLGAGELAEISYLEQVFGISRRVARTLLRQLHIKPVYIGKEQYFSLPTFQRIFYVLTKPGGKGFAFPGVKREFDDDRLREVDDEILAEAEDPLTLASMSTLKNGDTLLLRKMLDLEGKKMKAKSDE